MDLNLDAVEARVLGALIEKDLATPEYYPLSLNALVNACNQKTNREPVTQYDEDDVSAALERLRSKRLSAAISGPGIRVEKYAQRLGENFNFGTRDLALLAVLLLRGPQTLGELRERAGRMHSFDDLEAVEFTLHRLMEREPEPLVKRLIRAPGTKEARYAHLLSGDVVACTEPEPAPPPQLDRIARLEADLAGLRAEFEAFRRQFET